MHLLLSEYLASATFTATMGTEDDDEVFLSCSDEEVYKETGAKKGELVRGWRPKKAEDVVRLSEAVHNSPDGTIPLSWQCPGRRPPTPNTDEEYETDEEESGGKSSSAAAGTGGADAGQADPAAAEKEAAAAAMDFDFDADDEDGIKPGAGTPARRALHPGQQRELKGSARKKTTDFNSILSNMRRHKQMDAAKAKAAAAASSAAATSTVAAASSAEAAAASDAPSTPSSK